VSPRGSRPLALAAADQVRRSGFARCHSNTSTAVTKRISEIHLAMQTESPPVVDEGGGNDIEQEERERYLRHAAAGLQRQERCRQSFSDGYLCAGHTGGPTTQLLDSSPSFRLRRTLARDASPISPATNPAERVAPTVRGVVPCCSHVPQDRRSDRRRWESSKPLADRVIEEY